MLQEDLMKKLVFSRCFSQCSSGENGEAALGQSSRLYLGEALKAEPNFYRLYMENHSGLDGMMVLPL